jgi:hypothetical protein
MSGLSQQHPPYHTYLSSKLISQFTIEQLQEILQRFYLLTPKQIDVYQTEKQLVAAIRAQSQEGLFFSFSLFLLAFFYHSLHNELFLAIIVDAKFAGPRLVPQKKLLPQKMNSASDTKSIFPQPTASLTIKSEKRHKRTRKNARFQKHALVSLSSDNQSKVIQSTAYTVRNQLILLKHLLDSDQKLFTQVFNEYWYVLLFSFFH